MKKPWDYLPQLSEERLKIVAAMIVDARHAALSLFDEEAGDTAWSYGCRAYDWCRYSIIKASISGEYPWLSYYPNNGLEFAFSIGEVPVRFYKGDPDKPNDRTLKQCHPELNQLELELFDKDICPNLLWRLAIETFESGEVLSVTVIGCTRDGIPECLWKVPLSEMVPVINITEIQDDDGEDIPEPVVKYRVEHKRASNENDDK
ncbi:MAG TPA: hypothetical protein QGG18_10835 [Rhodospirillales bacterium]|nr:hypothetical protein [Rhodospirillales bacterium]